MTEQPELYTGLSGGRVLDVGTGRGGFAEELIAEFKDYDEIIGIDIDADLEEEFTKRVGNHPRVRFEQMNVMEMSFEDGSFDTVAIAGSLHHLDDPSAALLELVRVLRPGGRLIVVEMYRDGQTEAQQTHVILHHWWAAVDRLQGTVHRETYARDDVVDLVSALGLSTLTVRDYAYLDSNPRDVSHHGWFEPSIDKYLRLAAGHPDLIAQGAAIRERFHDIGFHFASVLVAMGEKGPSG